MFIIMYLNISLNVTFITDKQVITHKTRKQIGRFFTPYLQQKSQLK